MDHNAMSSDVRAAHELRRYVMAWDINRRVCESLGFVVGRHRETIERLNRDATEDALMAVTGAACAAYEPTP